MPIGGITTSFTSEFTMPVNAAPMMRPTARSTTLPRAKHSRYSFSIRIPPTAWRAGTHGTGDGPDRPRAIRRGTGRLVHEPARDDKLQHRPSHPGLDAPERLFDRHTCSGPAAIFIGRKSLTRRMR